MRKVSRHVGRDVIKVAETPTSAEASQMNSEVGGKAIMLDVNEQLVVKVEKSFKEVCRRYR